MKNGMVINNRYKIINKIGEGGMVNVYLSHDNKLNRLVTIKLIRLDFKNSKKAQRHFKYEKIAINKLNDSHIVKVYDVGDYKDNKYLVMEYVPGNDLKKYIQKNYPIDLKTVIYIMSQVLSAVNEAHKNGIIHRDLKPQNILITKDKNVKITDFGIALMDNLLPLTKTNSIVGSIHYISPEQILGKAITKKSDIYSLGIILYELLVGSVPFSGDSPVNIAMKHSNSNVPSIIRSNNIVPQSLENVVLKSTAKNPDDRYDSVIQMKDDLESSLLPERKNEAKLFFKVNSSNDFDDDKTKILDLNKDYNYDVNNNKTKKLVLVMLGLLFFIILIILLMHFIFFSKVQVPNVYNNNLKTAEQKIRKSRLLSTKVIYRHDYKLPHNHVIETIPKANTRLLNHSGIKLIVSDGESNIKMNNYVGKDYNKVYNSLIKMGFKVNKIYNYNNYFMPNHILNQNILPNTKVNPKKSTLNLVVSKYGKPFDMANLVGMDENAVKNYINKNHLKANYHYENTKDQPNGIVYQQNPSAGLKIQGGYNIELWISKGSMGNDNLNHSFNLSLTVPYKDTNDERGNKIVIYSNINGKGLSLYETMFINKDTKINIPYNLKTNEKIRYEVYRDGELIMK
ncbi:Stk1 family PASTA domain-containing Ser/Thr kinase [Apilactobacillus apisilvae]|uniref:non-specific serine/threonine protein kinase n=1 Tax=Apilactobacillus apisilvae TaxID=2923364 RepID=A0ABY4PIA3_9LACO|nr:Stk1 family PASTA domain-containing Ser/Thr kinase [Apilactobacillus apisilvae]UQS85327.1 Stk1 family PASTA domain-containing Ser/Thr kinase [Apilactobacillus apisilvae]